MGRIRRWLGKISIPSAFIICGLVCLLTALPLTKATVWFAQKNMNEIKDKYVTGQISELTGYEVPSSTLTGYELPFLEEDQKKYDFFVELDDIAAILWYSVCICIAALIFYLWKLKKPFHILNQAVQKVSENDLDFRIDYQGQDEFGRLCRAFEIMRKELEQNNRKMWNSVEERKRLNAAFAHDLRTPLTVIQGHTDLILASISEDVNISGEVLNSVYTISNQIVRLNTFADTMGTLQRLEDYEPCPKHISSSALTEMIYETATLLFSNGKVEMRSELKEKIFLLDQEALAQICENILSNAARYAKKTIAVCLYQEEKHLVITVEDDGTGFTKRDLVNASLAFYRGERTETGDVSHFGLGLYISNLLTEKLGGSLQISNRTGGGAKIQIKIYCN